MDSCIDVHMDIVGMPTIHVFQYVANNAYVRIATWLVFVCTPAVIFPLTSDGYTALALEIFHLIQLQRLLKAKEITWFVCFERIV